MQSRTQSRSSTSLKCASPSGDRSVIASPEDIRTSLTSGEPKRSLLVESSLSEQHYFNTTTPASAFSDDTNDESPNRWLINWSHFPRALGRMVRKWLCLPQPKREFEVERGNMRFRSQAQSSSDAHHIDDGSWRSRDMLFLRSQLSVCNPDENPSPASRSAAPSITRCSSRETTLKEKSLASRPNDEVMAHLSQKYPEVATELRSADSWATVRKVLRQYWTERNNGRFTVYLLPRDSD